jgi:hypothetical protein
MRNLLVLGLALAIGIGWYATRMMAPETAAGLGELAATKAGATVSVAMVVSAVAGPAALSGHLLVREMAGYARTARMLRVRIGPATRIVMGDRSSLVPGAILQVKGVAGDGATELRAEQIVILTGYVHFK